MTAFVDRALESAGLRDVLDARRAPPLPEAMMERLRAADLLMLGALADRIRRDEVGDEVRIYIGEPPAPDALTTVLPEIGSDITGLELLRQVAFSRVTAATAMRVRINWTLCGMELAQVALGFGADELCGLITSKAGMLISSDELLGVGKKSRRESARLVKQRELADCVRRSGRIPVVVGLEGTMEDALHPFVQESQ